jgi:type III secretory pathway component EscU
MMVLQIVIFYFSTANEKTEGSRLNACGIDCILYIVAYPAELRNIWRGIAGQRLSFIVELTFPL